MSFVAVSGGSKSGVRPCSAPAASAVIAHGNLSVLNLKISNYARSSAEIRDDAK